MEYVYYIVCFLAGWLLTYCAIIHAAKQNLTRDEERRCVQQIISGYGGDRDKCLELVNELGRFIEDVTMYTYELSDELRSIVGTVTKK